MPRSGHLRIAIAAVSTPWNNTAHPLPPTTLDSGHIPIPPCLWWYLEVIDHGLSHLEKRVGLVKHHGTAAPDCVLLEVCAQCVFVCVCFWGGDLSTEGDGAFEECRKATDRQRRPTRPLAHPQLSLSYTGVLNHALSCTTVYIVYTRTRAPYSMSFSAPCTSTLMNDTLSSLSESNVIADAASPPRPNFMPP